MTDRPRVAAGWECKHRFRDMQAGVCVYCGRYIMHNMARHVPMYHLDLGQLWRCPVLWCSHWKGTPQDYIDHIRLRHHVGLSVKPPIWNAALKQNMSGIFTHVMLFSEHGAQLVHHYRVYGDCVSHGSLCGTFMAKLTDFTNRACAEAWSVAKRGRDSSTGPGSSSSRPALSPLGPTHHQTTTIRARKAARAVASATSLLPLPRFAKQNLLWIRIPQSHLVATQLYPAYGR